MQDTKTNIEIANLKFAGTRGPWFTSPNSNYVRAEGVHGWNILTMEEQEPYTKANATLIALAPRLLENILQQAIHEQKTDEPDFFLREVRVKLLNELIACGALVNG